MLLLPLWLLTQANVEGPLLDRANATDLTAQPFYRWLEKAWFDLMGLRILLTWWFGGWEMVCWTMTVPLVMSWHSTFFVNSASHIWGSRPYVTGELHTPRLHRTPHMFCCLALFCLGFCFREHDPAEACGHHHNHARQPLGIRHCTLGASPALLSMHGRNSGRHLLAACNPPCI
jgi:hypothetical protein